MQIKISLKKSQLIIIALFILINSTCQAAITATGEGATLRSAIHNAMRQSIEQELGTWIDTRTIAKNHSVILDEINANATGFITSYEIKNQQVTDGIYFVELLCEVNSSASSDLANRLRLINTNADNPRIKIISNNSEVTAEIFDYLQRAGFTNIVETSDADYLVVTEINQNSLSAKLITSSGKILKVASSQLSTGMFSGSNLKFAARQIGWEISRQAFNYATSLDKRITLLITESTFKKIGTTITSVNNFTKNIDGVNQAFVRNVESGVELDISFQSIATDLIKI